MDVQHTVVHDS